MVDYCVNKDKMLTPSNECGKYIKFINNKDDRIQSNLYIKGTQGNIKMCLNKLPL